MELDLSSSGRGFQQTLLLTAYMLLHPNSVIMLDEPDAHLEILRQRQIYRAITETAALQRSQLLIATHSEVILNEAGDRHNVTAFVGTPHRITGRGTQVLKSLAEIGFESYLQAAQAGWVLYLEGSTDLMVLQAFARRLGHQADNVLERPFVHYVGNKPMQARQHFYGLREACPDLRGFALFDRLSLPDNSTDVLEEHSWRKREIENYLISRKSLVRWVMLNCLCFVQLWRKPFPTWKMPAKYWASPHLGMTRPRSLKNFWRRFFMPFSKELESSGGWRSPTTISWLIMWK